MTDDQHPDHDPLDALLRDAFDADQARLTGPPVTGRVMARIRTRQRLRGGVLGAAVALGLAVSVTFTGPVVSALLADLTGLLPAGWQHSTLGLTTVALLALVWLVFAEEEAL